MMYCTALNNGLPQYSPSAPPPSSDPPWVKRQTGENLLQSLKQMQLMEQASLQQMGVSDPLEAEFTEVVNPIMESCTKDSIAVSNPLTLVFV